MCIRDRSFSKADLMAAADRMHYQVSLGDFSQYFDGFGKCFIVQPQMLHGIQVEAHSNPAVVHHRDEVGDEFFCLEV